MSGPFLSRYSELEAQLGWSARKLARRKALDILSRLTSESGRPRIHILYLHHVLDDEVEGFRHLLNEVSKFATLISYSEAVSRILRGPIDRPYVAITLDDGLKSNLMAAAVLEEFGARGCFFVCTDMADDPPDAVAAAFCRDVLRIPHARFLNWGDMEHLMARGHEIGNHSAHHHGLASVGAAELEDGIAGSLALLRQRLGDVKHFAWPYGRLHDISDAARQVIFAAGHASCASAIRGAHVIPANTNAENLCIRRDVVVAGEPVAHNLYFIAKSGARASATDNDWPR
ncbi:MAG: polysaccharide deacetylase family protein [Alphaproteobacteria bacterium]|nr:polysaccharide deacetylase family protein [Alphaproteobacteria bacterium]